MELGNWKSSPALPDGQARAVLGVANGLTSKEAGRVWGVSASTINSALDQIREKLNGNYQVTGKRGWVVSEAIRRGWISPLMVLFVITSLLSGLVNPEFEIQVRRNSNRLSSRAVSRMMRSKGRKQSFIDIDISELDKESMTALLDMQSSEPNRLAPWSSVAWTRTFNFTNQDRLEMWRSQFNNQAEAA